MKPSSAELPAIEAACAVARAHGLAFAQPTSIGGASNVLVHLRPAPVVARVMTATALLHPEPRAWLQRELAVGAFLAEVGAPIVPPTDLLPPGPHEHGGYWMSFWSFVEHEPAGRLDEPVALADSLRELHCALADYPGGLPALDSVGRALARLLEGLAPTSELTEETLEAMSAELARVRPLAFETALPVQPIHGDASLSNLLLAEGGMRWNDFEDVCEGPVEWDLASLVVSMRHRGASARFVGEVLGAYGAPGVDDLKPFIDAHLLYEAVWQAVQARRASTTC